MKKPSVGRLIEFQQFMLAFRNIKRVIHIPGLLEEQENDAEHSYTLAMAGWFLAQYFPKLDRNTVIRLGLVHDLVEVHAGDTYFYAHESVLATKKQREQEAYEQLVKEWSDFPDLTEAIKEYEDLKTEESRFVYALDKIMPIVMIFLGKGHTWQKEKITLEMLHSKKKDKVVLSPEINEYYDQLCELLRQNQHFFHNSSNKKL